MTFEGSATESVGEQVGDTNRWLSVITPGAPPRNTNR